MERITDVNALLTHLGPVIYARDPLAALERAGILVDEAIPAEIRTGLRKDPLGMAGRQLAATYSGPTVPMSFSTQTDGDAAARLAPGTVGGFDVVGTVFLSSLEEILAKLWEALVYPQDLLPDQVEAVFGVELLRSHFTGIPDGAELASVLLPAPPRLHVVGPDRIALTQALRVQLSGPGGGVVELVADGTAVLPVALTVTTARVGLDLNRFTAETGVTLAVDPGSSIQPIDAAHLATFEAHVSPKVGSALILQAPKLDRSPLFDVPGGFTDSKLNIVHAAVWLSTWNGIDQVTFGLQVEPEPNDGALREKPTPDALAPFANLFAPDTISLIATESLIERGLRAVVASGELDDRISEKLEWLRAFQLPTRVEVDRVEVRLDDGYIKVRLHARYVGVCAFGVSFGFEMTVNLRPEIVGDRLRLTSEGVDVNLDNVDTVWCLLTSPLTGGWGFLLLTIGSAFAAVASPPFNKRTPGFWQGDRLPDSDAFPRIDLATAGAPSTGIMNLTGRFWLAPDELTTFVATQVLAVTDTTGEVGVITGAVVELSELGAPPPAGDDYVPPRDFTSERVEDDGTILRISTDYRETFGDQPLATAATERHGLARFAVPLDDVGGLIDVTIRRTLPTGPMFTTRHQWLATGDAPDLAVSVTIPDGSRPIVRHPIAVNLQERRLGTVQEPIRLVYADRCIPERQAVTAAEGKVNRIQTQLQELRDEFNRLPPSEREGLGRMIRRIEREDLPPVLAELRAATTARDACLGAP